MAHGLWSKNRSEGVFQKFTNEEGGIQEGPPFDFFRWSTKIRIGVIDRLSLIIWARLDWSERNYFIQKSPLRIAFIQFLYFDIHIHLIRKLFNIQAEAEKSLEMPGIDPGTSRMLSERSTIWATPPWKYPKVILAIISWLKTLRFCSMFFSSLELISPGSSQTFLQTPKVKVL